MGYYLMIKKLNGHKVKYLCKCMDNKDPYKYKGSGVYWRKIINKLNCEIKTEILGHYETKDELREAGLYYSALFNVVDSKEWANCIPESGDGGSTTKGKIRCYNPVTGEERIIDNVPTGWIKGSQYKPTLNKIRCHNTETNKYKMINPGEELPGGWELGGLKNTYKYGPQVGSKVYTNGDTKIYVQPGEPIPEDGTWKPGSGIQSTFGKHGYYDPNTNKKVYLSVNDSIPHGYIKGLPPTTGTKIHTPFGDFNSIAECMRSTKYSRDKIKRLIKNNEEWRFL